MVLRVGKDWPEFIPSKALHSGDAMNRITGNLGSFASVTAHAGGTKAAALPLNATNVIIAVCATGGDSVLLPPGYEGLTVHILNNGAASCQVFGAGTDTINGVATGTGVALANGAAAVYKCVGKVGAVGTWLRYVSA